MQANPAPRPPKPPFDRERFVFKILAVVIGTQLLIWGLAPGLSSLRPSWRRASAGIGPVAAPLMAPIHHGHALICRFSVLQA
jgi:hypothetical protein